MITSEGIGGNTVSQEHEQEHANVAGLLDQADDPVSHQSFASIASQMRAGVSVPLKRSMATMPVGEVTLISVSQRPPITSMPTKQQAARL
jgi:hypothetical protein